MLRSIECDLIVAPQPFEENARPVESVSLVRRRQRSLHDFSDASVSIDGVEQAFFREGDRQEEICEGVSLVYQNGGCPRW